MDDNPEQGRGNFTQDELVAMWRGRLTQEQLVAIKKESDERLKGWMASLSPEESDAWIAAHIEDLERKLRQMLGS